MTHTPPFAAPLGRLALAVLAAVGSLVAGSAAQDLLPAAPPQTGGVMLVGGTVHTVSGETIENGVVGFRDGRITLVGDASIMDRVLLTPDTEVIGVEGRHVYPGLFATGTRIGLTETSSVRATNDYSEIGGFTPEARAAVAINPDSTLIPVTRIEGVLLAGVSPSGGRIPGRACVIRLNGWTWEEMTVRDDAGLVVNWPSVRATPGAWRSSPEARDVERVRADLAEVGRFFDSASAYARARAQNPSHPTDLRLEAMGPYATPPAGDGWSPPLLINADDYDQIVSGVRFAAERGVRAVVVGGRDAPLCSDLLIEHDVPVIVGGIHRFPKRADSPHDHAYTLPARLAAAGVRFAIAGAERDGNTRNLANEAGMAARFGLDPALAVRAITLSPAEIMGVADDFGSLERGKSATLIVATGDILEVTTNIEHAWIDGRRVELRSKQTDLRDKFVEKYRQLGLIED